MHILTNISTSENKVVFPKHLQYYTGLQFTGQRFKKQDEHYGTNSSSHVLPPKDANALSARQQNTELAYLLGKFSNRAKFLKVDTSMA